MLEGSNLKIGIKTPHCALKKLDIGYWITRSDFGQTFNSSVGE